MTRPASDAAYPPDVLVDEDFISIYCTHCHKTHTVHPDEEECSPGAWLMPGERWPTDAH